LPTASWLEYPKVRSAARLHVVILPSRVTPKMASSEDSAIKRKYSAASDSVGFMLGIVAFVPPRGPAAESKWTKRCLNPTQQVRSDT